MRAVSTVYAAGKKEAAPEPDMHTHTRQSRKCPVGRRDGGVWEGFGVPRCA